MYPFIIYMFFNVFFSVAVVSMGFTEKQLEDDESSSYPSSEPGSNYLKQRMAGVLTGLLVFGLTYSLFASAKDTFPSFETHFVELAVTTVSVVLFSFYFSKLVWRTKANLNSGPPYFKLGVNRIIPFDRRVALICAIWVLMALISSIMITLDAAIPGLIARSFLASWLANGVFFTFVGAAVSLTGLRLPHKESFDTRLSILFSGNKSEAMKATRDRVRALGFFVENYHCKIELREFSTEFQAYRVEVETSTTLRNLFGDVPADDSMGFHFTPDDFGDTCPSPIGGFTYMEVRSDPDDHRRIRNEIPIDRTGTQFSQTFSVGSEPEEIIVKYWAWVKIDAAWEYLPKRFTEKANMSVINTLDNPALEAVISFIDQSGAELDELPLKYGQKQDHGEMTGLTMGTDTPFLKLRAPREIAADC